MELNEFDGYEIEMDEYLLNNINKELPKLVSEFLNDTIGAKTNESFIQSSSDKEALLYSLDKT
jgi:hypothetical protein